MPDSFTDIAKVTRSHIPAANVPARLEVPRNGHNTMDRVVKSTKEHATTTLSGGVAEAVVP